MLEKCKNMQEMLENSRNCSETKGNDRKCQTMHENKLLLLENVRAFLTQFIVHKSKIFW